MKTNKSSQRFAALWCMASLFLCLSLPLSARHLTLSLAEHGIGEGPGNKHFCSQLQHLLDSVRAQQRSGDKITLLLAPQATYHLYAPDARRRNSIFPTTTRTNPKRWASCYRTGRTLHLRDRAPDSSVMVVCYPSPY